MYKHIRFVTGTLLAMLFLMSSQGSYSYPGYPSGEDVIIIENKSSKDFYVYWEGSGWSKKVQAALVPANGTATISRKNIVGIELPYPSNRFHLVSEPGPGTLQYFSKNFKTFRPGHRYLFDFKVKSDGQGGWWLSSKPT